MCRNSTILGYSVSSDCPFGLTPVWFYGTRKNQRLKGRSQGWVVSLIYQSLQFLRLHTISPSFNAFNVTNANSGLWDTALYTRDRVGPCLLSRAQVQERRQSSATPLMGWQRRCKLSAGETDGGGLSLPLGLPRPLQSPSPQAAVGASSHTWRVSTANVVGLS